MVSVGSMSQLERMGSELRCPICLSLYKTAATISCNHTFCRSCILESLRSISCCPVCKTHSSRREVRPAPQMDSFVEIFRGMETSAGVCLFATQPSSQPAYPEKRLVDEKGKAGEWNMKRNGTQSKKKKATNKTLDPRKRRRKGKSDESESDDDSDVEQSRGVQYEQVLSDVSNAIPPKGVVLAKKRVQVSQTSHMFLDLNLQSEVDPEGVSSEQNLEGDPQTEYRPSTSISADQCTNDGAEKSSGPGLPLDFLKPPTEVVPPLRQEEISKRLVELLRSDDTVQQNNPIDLNLDLELQGFPSLRQAFNELPQLTPFFWLPNDPIPTQDELPTQTQLSAQPLRPAFSDLKDSDDEGSLDDVQQPVTMRSRGSGEAEGYDSETFEWTQRPCSPELSCSPTRYGLQASSTRSSVGPQSNETLKQSMPGVAEAGEVVGNQRSETHGEVLRKRVQGAPNRRAKLSSCHNEEICPENPRRTLRGRTISDGKSPSLPHPGSKTLPSLQSGAASDTPTDRMDFALKQPVRTKDNKDCAAAANKFLSLLRDGPPEVGPQPLLADAGITVPKVQVENSSGGENTAPVERSEAIPEARSPACRFCGGTGNSEVAGEMMRYQTGTTGNKFVQVHKLCAEWAPNVYFEEEDDCPKNLTSEISRGGRIKCIICGKKGAALGCCNNKCKNSYHYPCARRIDGCQWNEDDYIMFCPQHARGRFPKARRQSGDSSNSTLETERVEVLTVPADRPHPSVDRGPSAALEESKASKWASGLAHKWVLCGSGLDSQLKAQVASFASLVGATLVKDWSAAVTHVITGTDEEGAAKRTLKYLLAMLEGKWIVKIDWMNECISKKQPVAEEPHLVTCDVNGFFGGPCLSRHLAVSKAPKLFEGLSFYLCGDFTPVLKADLHSLVTTGGGTVLHRKPLPLPVSSYSELSSSLQEVPHAGQSVVLYNGEADSGKGRNLAQRIQEAMSVSIPAGALALPCSWLLDSIAHCRLLPPN